MARRRAVHFEDFLLEGWSILVIHSVSFGHIKIIRAYDVTINFPILLHKLSAAFLPNNFEKNSGLACVSHSLWPLKLMNIDSRFW